MPTLTLVMQLILANGILGVAVYCLKRDWLKAATWICLTTYLLLDRLIPPTTTSPPVLINSVLVILLVLVAYQIFKRKKPPR
ncbi:MAG: hypothetical protein WBD81_14555 [Collimonas pratensis]|uniref:hypothetical protein n=1 Tax=Collimonas pratensis TaxID=279113 RepID=UPI003C73D14F